MGTLTPEDIANEILMTNKIIFGYEDGDHKIKTQKHCQFHGNWDTVFSGGNKVMISMYTHDVEVYFSKNYVVAKDSKTHKELSKIELPNGMDSDRAKFASFCRVVTAVYLAEGVGRDIIRPVSNYAIGNRTFVRFSDGGEENCAPVGHDLGLYDRFGNYFGIDICFAKHLFGSTSAIMRELKKCDVVAKRAEEKAWQKEEEKKRIERLREIEKKFKEDAFRDEVDNRIEEILIERAARERIARIDAAEERRRNSQE